MVDAENRPTPGPMPCWPGTDADRDPVTSLKISVFDSNPRAGQPGRLPRLADRHRRQVAHQSRGAPGDNGTSVNPEDALNTMPTYRSNWSRLPGPAGGPARSGQKGMGRHRRLFEQRQDHLDGFCGAWLIPLLAAAAPTAPRRA